MFPDISALAEADDDFLLKNWEGLGYYSRARNLKKAAIVIMEQYNGRMPDTWELLQNLPGIGSYTAGAIASIAYGRCVPAVDGNVLRVLSRLRMDDAFITQKEKMTFYHIRFVFSFFFIQKQTKYCYLCNRFQGQMLQTMPKGITRTKPAIKTNITK